MQNPTIMVVEDNPTNMKLLGEILKMLKCRVLQAQDGLEALELLDGMDELPRVILTDVMMPQMDGIEFTKRLRGTERYRELPVVIISAFATERDKKAAAEAGCSEYITKPLQIRTLMEKISPYLH